MNTHDGTIHTAISGLTAAHAAKRNGGAAEAGAIIECICGAAAPMVGGLFTGGTLQERLLFTLVLAGACAMMREEGNDGYGLRIDVCPETLREAFTKFTSLTGGDIRPHLPDGMVRFAAGCSLN